jgi:hypothetical protein
MSDGIRHHELWRQGWSTALPLSLAVYGASDLLRPAWACSQIGCFAGNDFYTIGTLLGYGFGMFVNPDADQVSITHAEGLMINKIPILGHFLYGYWQIYGSIFRKHHRSFWTHFPIISTIIRFVYQFWAVYAILIFSHISSPWIYQTLAGIFLGMCYSDYLHWLEDKRSGEKKHSRKTQ